MQRPSILTFRDLIGNTPLLELPTLGDAYGINLYAKLEMYNAGGSMKDRPAFAMIEQALKEGLIAPGATVIESSSGNMGIGLALACQQYGLTFICVADSRTTPTNIQIMEAYGARVEIIDKPTGGRSLLESRRARVRELLKKIPGSYNPNQYVNLANPAAHEHTFQEIVQALGTAPDTLLCAVGTCGTIRGCSDYKKTHNLTTKIVAVDAVGSVIYGDESRPRLIPGHGAAIRPEIWREDLADHVLRMSDLDCVKGCRKLLASEGVFAGGSSGAIVSALEQCKSLFSPGSRVVMILGDRGERYLDTVYNDAWVHEHFSDIKPAEG